MYGFIHTRVLQLACKAPRGDARECERAERGSGLVAGVCEHGGEGGAESGARIRGGGRRCTW